MRPSETAARPVIAGDRVVVRGWGGGAGVPVTLVTPVDLDDVRAGAVDLPGGAIARGRGRSYGDAAQLRDGVVVSTARLTRSTLDADRGTVSAEAGVTIGELLVRLAPHGFVVPVVPGTQHVSVGGAIASDIHGKNHGVAGAFGSYVEELGLLTAAGEVLELEPADELFQATVGGMGLTGVILWARLRLRRVESALLAVDTDRVGDLDAALAVLSGSGGPHRVAWLDLLRGLDVRGVVTRAEHAPAPGPDENRGRPTVAARPTVDARATVPGWFPAGALRPGTVGAFNALRFRLAPRRERGRLESFGRHMFPLDGLSAWPRLYGASGFLQYQLAVPAGREPTLEAVIGCLAAARVPCFLAVLKDFGEAGPAPLSFPIRGWTLALDLPRAAPGIAPALRRCDELVAEAGGRVYLTKDARLAPATVEAMYPRLEEWRAVRDGVDPDRRWRSDLALRTGLVRR
jgi:decaprenylphospho-beta-D-ribofuranose 2-oxidase